MSGDYTVDDANDSRFYLGKPCGKCGTTRRYTTSRVCAGCGGSGRLRVAAVELTDDDVDLVAQLQGAGVSQVVIAEKFEVSRARIARALRARAARTKQAVPSDRQPPSPVQ